MADASWKAFERRIAKFIGGRRRGAYTGGTQGGRSDIIHDAFAPECKLLGRSSHAAILLACVQAEANAEPGQTPVAFVKRKRDLDNNTVVAMRLEAWLEWYGPSKPQDDT